MGGTDASSMRSVDHNNMKPGANSHGPIGHSLAGLVGGKRRRSKKGSRKTRAKRSKNSRSKRVKRGGMGAGFGFGAALKEAIVPFGIFAMQKKSQRRRNNKKSFRRNRTNKRRR
jgi:hypothetical protein